MKPRTTLILGLVLALLITGILVYEKVWKVRNVQQRMESTLVFAALDLDAIAGIELKKGDANTILKLQSDATWIVASEDDYPADLAGIEKIKDTLGLIKLDNLVSTNKSSHARLEVDEALGLQVRLLDKADKSLAEFVVGKRGESFDSGYFRLTDQDRTYMVYQNLSQVFDRSGKTWRDLGILSFNESDARMLTLSADGWSLALERNLETTGWELQDGDTTAIKKWSVDSIVRSLGNLTASAFAGDTFSVAAAGLEPGQKTASVKMADNTVHTLLVGNEDQENSRVLVKTDSQETIFYCSKYTIDNIFKSKDELIDKQEPSAPESFLPPPRLEDTRLDKPALE